MMRREEVIRILKDHLKEIKAYQVKSLAIFGSVARNDAKADSDVDILVEFEPDASVGLFEFYRLQRFLTQTLGCSVDLATPESLRDEIKEDVFKELVYAA